MAEVLLIFPGRRITALQALAHLRLPYSLLCLAGHLREHGIASRIVDLRLDRIEEIEAAGSRVVGFSCMTGHQIRSALEAARFLRPRLPDAIFVWGGIHPSLLPEETARHPLVDAVVVGEGEETLREIVVGRRAGRSPAGIAGTVVRTDAGMAKGEPRPFIDLDRSAFPAYDLIELRRYPRALDMFDYQSSRGCPHRCGFCYNVRFCGRRWRAKSPEKTVEELERIRRLHGARSISFVDDEFFIDRRRAEAILDRMLERRLRLRWTASCRVDICRRFTPAFFAKLVASGCKQIYFGGESGSDATLEAIGKEITTEDTIEAVRACIANGVVPIVSFMGGFPGETMPEFRRTLDLISRIWSIHPSATVNGIFPFSPYPGTELFERARALGLKVPSDLEGWGEWSFQYAPDHPWMRPEHRRALRVAFYIVRFQYHCKELALRNPYPSIRRSALELLSIPLRLSAALRWRRRAFAAPLEWELWALMAREAFGFL